MKSYLAIFMVVIMFCCLSCSKNKQHRDILLLAEEVMEYDPDSAYEILNNIDNLDNMSENDRALYGLLFTKALDKTYVPFSSDSLISATLEYYEYIDDPVLLSQALYYAGRVNEEMYNFPRAIQCYLRAIDESKNSNDYKFLFLLHYYLGNLYLEQELFNDGLAMHKKASIYSLLLEDSLSISYAYNAIGNAFAAKAHEDSALWYYKQALNNVQIDDSSMIGYLCNSVSSSYSRLGLYREAMEYIDLSQKMQSDSVELIYVYTIKAQIYANTKRYDLAKNYYDKGLKSNNLYTQATCNEGLANIFSSQGNYKRAFSYFQNYISIRDSIEKNVNAVAVIQMKEIYKNMQLKDENTALHLSKMKAIANLYKISFAFTLIIIVILYCYFKLRIKKNNKIKQREKELFENIQKNQQAEMIRLKNQNQLEEQKRKEILLRETFFRKLVTVSVDALNNINTERHVKLSDNDWNNIVENLDIAFDQFTVRLKKMFPNLSIDDIHFCCLVKMKLTMNDLTAIYCMEKTSIYKKKERIKKMKMCFFDSRSLDEILRVL